MMPCENQIKNGYLHDSFGNKCTRRLFGTILLSLGISMGMILFLHGLYCPDSYFETSYNVMQSFMIGGGGLLGIGLLENLRGCFNKR
jgi:hypothetical protein